MSTRPSWSATLVGLVVLAIWLVAGKHCAGAAAQDKAVPPEMKILEKRLGAWTTVARGKAAEWTPQGFESKGDEKIELVMHGRFIQGKVRTQPGDVEATWLATYDTGKKVYRIWYFSSEGDIFDATGKWDPKPKQLHGPASHNRASHQSPTGALSRMTVSNGTWSPRTVAAKSTST
jgi:hypothetical protein